MATGHCLCGTVTYELTGDPMMVLQCHCTRCQRMTGSAFFPLALVQTDQLTVKTGEDSIHTYREEGYGNRAFCTKCGSNLFGFHWPDSGPMTTVSLGTLDHDSGIKPGVHINTAFKAPWHEILDDLEQMEGMPSGG